MPVSTLPPSPVVHPIDAPDLRDAVVDAAAALTATVVEGDTAELLEALERLNPALARRLRDLTDSTMALDDRTGFMAAHYPHAAP